MYVRGETIGGAMLFLMHSPYACWLWKSHKDPERLCVNSVKAQASAEGVPGFYPLLCFNKLAQLGKFRTMHRPPELSVFVHRLLVTAAILDSMFCLPDLSSHYSSKFSPGIRKIPSLRVGEILTTSGTFHCSS